MAAASSTARRPRSTRCRPSSTRSRGRIPVLLDGGVRRGADVVEGAGARRRGLPDRAAAALGPGGRRRSRRRASARHLPPRDRPRHGAVRRRRDRRHRREICSFAPNARQDLMHRDGQEHRRRSTQCRTFPIVDSHVHLYDVERSHATAGWSGVPKINRTYAARRISTRRAARSRSTRSCSPRSRSIPACIFEEAAFVQETGRRATRGFAAWSPMRRWRRAPAIEADLVAAQEVPQPARHPPADRDRARPDLLPRARLPRGRAAAAASTASPSTSASSTGRWCSRIELARRCPEVTFVLDHIGKPGIQHGLREPWWSQIRELARAAERRLQGLGRDHRGRPRALDARSR